MKINLGQTISILANFGVIAGIVFLAVQIREDREQAVIANSLFSGAEITGWMQDIGSGGEPSNLLFRGSQNFHDLSDEEKFRFDWLIRAYIMKIGISRATRDRGLAFLASDEPESRLLEGEINRLMSQPGVRQWWASADRRGIPHPNADFIDEVYEQANAAK